MTTPLRGYAITQSAALIESDCFAAEVDAFEYEATWTT